MSGVKISALPAVSSALSTDYFPVVQAGATSRETLLQVSALFGFNNSGGIGQLGLAAGGTNANLTAALGAVPYSTASAFALLAPGSSGQLLQSQGGAAPVWTTATYPTTTTINQILFSSAANTVTGIATANNKILSTNGSGVPSFGLAYATGSWTPAIQFGGASTGVTYSVQTGEYTQIGNVVFVTARITLSSKGTSTGAATIAGLPVTPGGSVSNMTTSVSLQNTTIHNNNIEAQMVNGSTTILLYYTTTAAQVTAYADTDFTATSDLILTGMYMSS